jgi:hypothetical protein
MTSRSRFTPEGFGLNGAHMVDRGLLAGAATPSKDWVRHRAVRTLAHHAADAGELADWLGMLGLDPEEGR